MNHANAGSNGTVRYAVVGLGHIAQTAVLPAFQHAKGCALSALVSGDAEKLWELSEMYQVPRAIDYAGYDDLLASGEVDAVYIALPNELHADFAVRAARSRVHVLCEKPLAPSEEECKAMVDAARVHGVHLMTAYRLHFEHLNMEVAELVQKRAIGDARIFSSVFSQTVKPDDIRLAAWDRGGGSVFDMGVYCINAVRFLFREEPIEVMATAQFGTDERFDRCDEMTAAVLHFPSGRIAQFCSSFGAMRSGDFRLTGTAGEIVVHNAYDYAKPMSYELRSDRGEQRTKEFAVRDQFGPELQYFAECIRLGREPEPNGGEGYADVRIVRAIHESARTGRRVRLQPMLRSRWPTLDQARWKPAVLPPEEVNAEGPSGD